MITTAQVSQTNLLAIDALLDALRSEPEAATKKRESCLFDGLAGSTAESIILFGAGSLGRFTLTGLRRLALEPLCFVDNDPARWQTSVEGLKVLAPHDAISLFGQSACFVVTIYNGSAVRQQLQEMGCRTVIPVHPLFWKYPETFIPSSCTDLPHTLLRHADQIRECYSILGDEESRRELREQVRWRWSLDYEDLSAPLPAAEMHFAPDLVQPLRNEVFVDCGAFDGDSIRAFMARRGNAFSHLYALEPDEGNCAALQRGIHEMAEEIRLRITVLPFAVSNRKMRARFDASNSVVSKLTGCDGSTYVECRRLDDILAGARPTHIKMDVEGAEPEAIEGTADLLRTVRPVISACAYHRNEHLWQLPLLLHDLAPDYKIFLRRYAEECWELVCYGVPAERIPSERLR